MMRTRLAAPLLMYWSAIESAKSEPAHAALTSNAAALTAPIFACTNTAHAGNGISGVTVPTMISPSSSALQPAASSAIRAAWAAMSLVASSGAARLREPMPVRSRIHASLVSMPSLVTRSSLVSTSLGRYEPVPRTLVRSMTAP
jgi:hypothetical protein